MYFAHNYVELGLLMTLVNFLVNAFLGATLVESIRAEARKTWLPKFPWFLQLLCLPVLWPLSVSYSGCVVVGLLPKKSWQQLNDEYK
jgi:hypothetical protein